MTDDDLGREAWRLFRDLRLTTLQIACRLYVSEGRVYAAMHATRGNKPVAQNANRGYGDGR